MPRLAVDALREGGDHMLADMIEGMADRIDELERKLLKHRSFTRKRK